MEKKVRTEKTSTDRHTCSRRVREKEEDGAGEGGGVAELLTSIYETAKSEPRSSRLRCSLFSSLSKHSHSYTQRSHSSAWQRFLTRGTRMQQQHDQKAEMQVREKKNESGNESERHTDTSVTLNLESRISSRSRQ